MNDEQPASKKPAVIRVNGSWCKRCGICVAFCPKDVLEINEGNLEVARPDDCIACMLCELRCPDFAITVEKE
ncbi:MAG: 4Fe-4S dicluster domain-containing protein [Candidatus Latescibacteria bacterium]|nr:4Fe-4S dicluster domain-containing protein [bacterium]MBD3424737.1 4Fe-4S dicluster domain-containing protein [Candidatus Latescibacterota bacterium]